MSTVNDERSAIGRHPNAAIEGFDSLAELALDVRWSWNHATDDIWRILDEELWDATQNPWVLLQTVSRDRLRTALTDPAFRKGVDSRVSAKRAFEAAPTWYGESHSDAPLAGVGYFSMEFMLSEALPIYSGGLGNVAGDQLKTASDLGVPVTGVGLLYQQGYFRQVVDQNGAQYALYPYNDPGQLPITPLRTPDGEWLRLRLAFPGGPLTLRAWQVHVGRARLFLLDANDPENLPARRGITSELYGGGSELRLQQEIVLGIGGWRLLEALGMAPNVLHLNEGHAAFAVLERARSFQKKSGKPFDVSLAATRAGNLFTTHTAVAAGFDLFPGWLLEHYLSEYASTLGIGFQELAGLGRQNPDDQSADFNMAYLAMRGCGAVNGVSKLHAEVSTRLFAPVFPRWPVYEVPVGFVTNGIHVDTWDSPAADEIWTKYCGSDCWRNPAASPSKTFRNVTDEELWTMRTANRRAMVNAVRKRYGRQVAAVESGPDALETARNALNPDVLTLGFARRFATYKRPNLLLSDPDRLARILSNGDRPVQLILAGKAHPADYPGQSLIGQWIQFLKRPDVRGRAVFLADYDMRLSGELVAGVDVWINTPRRPWEACGTSGMKVLVNGALNFSELDGWWAEAYTPDVGWALGDGQEHGDNPSWDFQEAGDLYNKLEQEIIPEFYRRGSSGVPTDWVTRMRESMCTLTPEYSTLRAVKEYTELFYIPAALGYESRAADTAAEAVELTNWQADLNSKWSGMRFGQRHVEEANKVNYFSVELFLGEIAPDDVQVQLVADAVGANPAARVDLKRGPSIAGGYIYKGSASAARPCTDYTARAIPRRSGLAVPLECDLILWQS